VNTFKSWLRKVKAPQLLAVLVLSLGFLAGCGMYPQQNPYMLTGAGLGAAGGAALGIASSPNNPWRGAAIGGLLGTALGGVAGEAYGRSVAPAPAPQAYYQAPPAAGYGPPPPQGGYSYAPPQPAY
jgi:hypothetical protein